MGDVQASRALRAPSEVDVDLIEAGGVELDVVVKC